MDNIYKKGALLGIICVMSACTGTKKHNYYTDVSSDPLAYQAASRGTSNFNNLYHSNMELDDFYLSSISNKIRNEYSKGDTENQREIMEASPYFWAAYYIQDQVKNLALKDIKQNTSSYFYEAEIDFKNYPIYSRLKNSQYSTNARREALEYLINHKKGYAEIYRMNIFKQDDTSWSHKVTSLNSIYPSHENMFKKFRKASSIYKHCVVYGSQTLYSDVTYERVSYVNAKKRRNKNILQDFFYCDKGRGLIPHNITEMTTIDYGEGDFYNDQLQYVSRLRFNESNLNFAYGKDYTSPPFVPSDDTTSQAASANNGYLIKDLEGAKAMPWGSKPNLDKMRSRLTSLTVQHYILFMASKFESDDLVVWTGIDHDFEFSPESLLKLHGSSRSQNRDFDKEVYEPKSYTDESPETFIFIKYQGMYFKLKHNLFDLFKEFAAPNMKEPRFSKEVIEHVKSKI
jgi:hypothetical protein